MNPHSGRQTKKLIFTILLLWVLSNHCIRLLSGPAAAGSAANPTGAFPTSSGEAFATANGFRIAAGKHVKNLDSYCPQAVGGFCSMTMQGFVAVLGLS